DHIGVIFSEDMVGEGEFASAVTESVTNLDNWDLTCDGKSVKSLIDNVIVYGVSEIHEQGLTTSGDGKYEVVITFAEREVTSTDRSDVTITSTREVTLEDGSTETVYYTRDLPEGTYTLTLRRTVEDIFGNPLDGNRDGISGDAFVRTFSVGEPGSSTNTGGVSDIESPGANPTTEDQAISASVLRQTDPVVACDANGNYVLVWVEYRPTDPTLDLTDPDVTIDETTEVSADIMARRYDSRGQAIGEAWLVNNLTGFIADDQLNPDISMDSDGNFVIVWEGWSSTDTDGGICMRSYSSTGVPQGGIVQVNVTRMGYQTNPSVALSDDGLIVVTWCGPSYSVSSDGLSVTIASSISDVYMAVFRPSTESTAANRTPVRVTTAKSLEEVTNLRVNTTTAYDQLNPSVAISEDGEFAVVWESSWQEGSGRGKGIYGRWFQATRTGVTAETGEIHINEGTANIQNDQTCPDIEMDNAGNAVIAWQSSQNASTTGTDIYARMFGPGGVATSESWCVNYAADDYGMNYTWNNQVDTWVTVARGTGNFSISWTSIGQESYWGGGNSEGVYGRLYRADGTAATDAVTGNDYGVYRLNNWVQGDQNSSSIALSDNGLLIGVWHGPQAQYYATSDAEGTTYGTDVVYARIMSVSGMSKSGGSGSEVLAELPASFRWYLEGSSGYAGGDEEDSTTYRIAGTSGDDVIVVTTAASLEDWIVTVNGVNMTIPTGTTGLEVVAGDGSDTLRVVNPDGTASDVSLGTASGSFSRGGETLFTWSGAESTYYDGAAADTVSLEGTSGVDTVTMDPLGTVILTATGGTVSVSGATGSVAVSGLGGKDVLSLEGTSGTDQVVATADQVTMTTIGSQTQRSFTGFTDVTLYGSGRDTLDLTGSDSVDQFVASASGASLVTGSSTIRSSGFLRTRFVAGAGTDRVTLQGSVGRDTLSVSSTNSGSTVNFVSGSASYVISGAEVVGAEMGTGDDVVNLTHTGSRNGALVGRENVTTWKVSDLDLTVTGATRLSVRGTSGDTATLYDSAGNDVLTSKPGQVKLSRSTSVHKLTGFGSVTVLATAGGYDSAAIVGGSGDDVFTSTPESVSMVSEGYTLKASGFGKVIAQAGKGGSDVATLSDSVRYTTNDSLTVTPSSVTLSSGSRQSVSVKSFGTVKANSNSGNDVATFTTSTGDDTFAYAESTNAASLTGTYLGTHYGVTATGYGTVSAVSKGGTDAAIFDLSDEDDLTISGEVATALVEGASVTATGFATNSVTKSVAASAVDAAIDELFDE
ncbi:MAG: hypothetical protein Q4C47_00110, partial [Planctomycetia bacterium]|nr:hypothetical protein [Planctomycetia bacterium]